MKLIIGLGNVGERYKHTRHNVGFMILDKIAQKNNINFSFSKKFNAETVQFKIKNTNILLAKPQTFMNNSGIAVVALMQYYKCKIEDIIVIQDELDLQSHIVKIKKGGGNAGHNGLKSISTHCGNEYVRVRYGIGRPDQNSKIEIADYVLQNFSSEDLKIISDKSDIISEKLENIILSDYNLII